MHCCHRRSDTDSQQDSYSRPLAFEAGILLGETEQGVDSRTGDSTCRLRDVKLLLIYKGDCSLPLRGRLEGPLGLLLEQ